MTASAIECEKCSRAIGKQQIHVGLKEVRQAWCAKCFGPRTREGSAAAHALAYPTCPIDWHDMYDHEHAFGTRAAMSRWFIKEGWI